MEGRPLPPGRRGRPVLKKTELKTASVIEIHCQVEPAADTDNRSVTTIEEAKIEQIEETSIRPDSADETLAESLQKIQVDERSVEPPHARVDDAPPTQPAVDEPSPKLDIVSDVDTQQAKTTPSFTSNVPDAPLVDEARSLVAEVQQVEHVEVPTVAFEAPIEEPVVATPGAVAETYTKANEAPAGEVPPAKAESNESVNSSGGHEVEGECYGLELLVRPFDSVPELLPLDQLECLYNDEAVMLQKQILRAVKWCTKHDKMKLEEFKINSRLYGNGFMEPQEYVNSMAHELGPLNMLVIVPCMLRLQPVLLQKEMLYVALQTYRAKNISTLGKLIG
ncbi:unnamed protein product [Aphanomyces euteiches]|uniref:Uncharacterized protein n=1 Tax=Aphanomyces euteiches TaxID=100861 RepID=A0A6G0WBE9_9STRA|nr:hypothetical protein Ae201684_016773 [Aphanomyces euteiches]KAH9075914.1 hypothetical protein Ae201684P_012406 [Aphanomyces euteiches]KAH9139913.1 hypothetical protein AeRB84_015814 [Aphanomyces euteiches]